MKYGDTASLPETKEGRGTPSPKGGPPPRPSDAAERREGVIKTETKRMVKGLGAGRRSSPIPILETRRVEQTWKKRRPPPGIVLSRANGRNLLGSSLWPELAVPGVEGLGWVRGGPNSANPEPRIPGANLEPTVPA